MGFAAKNTWQLTLCLLQAQAISMNVIARNLSASWLIGDVAIFLLAVE